MESAGLYLEGMRCGKNALCLCAIVEDTLSGAETSSEETQIAIDRMVRIALETAIES